MRTKMERVAVSTILDPWLLMTLTRHFRFLKEHLHGGQPEAVDTETLRRENEELQKRNRELEAKVAELTAAVSALL